MNLAIRKKTEHPNYLRKIGIKNAHFWAFLIQAIYEKHAFTVMRDFIWDMGDGKKFHNP